MLTKGSQFLKRYFTHQCKQFFKASSRYNQNASATQVTPYFQQMYESWLADKSSVHPLWQDYFVNMKGDVRQVPQVSMQDQDKLKQMTNNALNAFIVIRNYLMRGHEKCDLDPLKLKEKYGDFKEFGKRIKNLSIEEELNISKMDLDSPFVIENGSYLKRLANFLNTKDTWTLREITQILRQIYCGKAGFEFMHIEEAEKRMWLIEKIEQLGLKQPTPEQRRRTLDRLAINEAWNTYCKNKFSTTKRFGIEGCDSFISGLDYLAEECANFGVENVVIGMPHRGRLNTLAFVLGKKLEQIFAEFQDIKYYNEGQWGQSGDVKYHLGVTNDRVLPNGKKINMRILANASHLEAINPVVSGATRAIQDFKQDYTGNTVLGILVHGDSAFSGQGVVYETLQMADLYRYTPHGIIHIIVNNQIGYTTTPMEFRSGFYSTDVAKTIDAPIFHVNADEPDQVDQVLLLALEYRQKFKKDVVVEIIGYRRYGHNELDQPMFTQPMMYKAIDKQLPVCQIYSQKLIKEGVITQTEYDAKMKGLLQMLDKAYMTSRTEQFNINEWKSKEWERVMEPVQFGKVKNTNVPVEKLKEIGRIITDIPTNFNLHPLIKKIFAARRESIETGKKLDMATAESLAFASLLYEGFNVRISGQDVERGTFSHRHIVLHDQQLDRRMAPIQNILTPEQRKKKKFLALNSHLSEYGVLGFEYGYSLVNPNTLTIWEAQFGDFANGATTMIDNFISSGESKWNIPTGLVMLLPHGMDGQGAEHSSGRIERYLQMSDDDMRLVNPNRTERMKKQIRNCNWQVIYCSTTVNYFHALRRQMRRDFRKPLICFESKKLLRYKPCCSDLEEFEKQIRFQTIYGEVNEQMLMPPKDIKRVVVCTGQVYYDIIETRDKQKRNDIAVLRVEQLSPFPYDMFKSLASQYTNAEFIWCQEEHQNAGAWSFIEPRINLMLNELYNEKKIKNPEVSYIGRKPAASTATGSHVVHDAELKKFLDKLFSY